MYKFRINKKNSNIYLINDNINNKNLEYKKNFTPLFKFSNKDSISSSSNIFNRYYKWYLNSLFFSRKKVISFNTNFTNSLKDSNLCNIKWKLKNKSLNITVKKKSYKMKSLQFLINYWSNCFNNDYDLLKFPLYKNFELSRQCLTYILLDNKTK